LSLFDLANTKFYSLTLPIQDSSYPTLIFDSSDMPYYFDTSDLTSNKLACFNTSEVLSFSKNVKQVEEVVNFDQGSFIVLKTDDNKFKLYDINKKDFFSINKILEFEALDLESGYGLFKIKKGDIVLVDFNSPKTIRLSRDYSKLYIFDEKPFIVIKDEQENKRQFYDILLNKIYDFKINNIVSFPKKHNDYLWIKTKDEGLVLYDFKSKIMYPPEVEISGISELFDEDIDQFEILKAANSNKNYIWDYKAMSFVKKEGVLLEREMPLISDKKEGTYSLASSNSESFERNRIYKL